MAAEKRLDLLGPLRKFTHGGILPQDSRAFSGRNSVPDLAVRDVVHHPGTRADGDALSDLQVITDAAATTDLSAVADFRAPRDSDLSADDAESSDDAVVSDLAQIVDLRAFPDPGGSEFPSIDARSRADLDVIGDLDVSEMRDLQQSISFRARAVAESVRAHDRVRMQHAVLTDPGTFVKHRARIDQRSEADGDVRLQGD